jgi:hypothetical protein
MLDESVASFKQLGVGMQVLVVFGVLYAVSLIVLLASRLMCRKLPGTTESYTPNGQGACKFQNPSPVDYMYKPYPFYPDGTMFQPLNGDGGVVDLEHGDVTSYEKLYSAHS